MEHKHEWLLSVTSCDHVHLEHYQHQQEKTTIDPPGLHVSRVGVRAGRSFCFWSCNRRSSNLVVRSSRVLDVFVVIDRFLRVYFLALACSNLELDPVFERWDLYFS
jgi:hypothetical protein